MSLASLVNRKPKPTTLTTKEVTKDDIRRLLRLFEQMNAHLFNDEQTKASVDRDFLKIYAQMLDAMKIERPWKAKF